MVQVLSTLAGGNGGNLTRKVEESAMQMAKQGTLTALKLAKISAGEFVDAMGTMPEQDVRMICRLLDILGKGGVEGAVWAFESVFVRVGTGANLWIYLCFK